MEIKNLNIKNYKKIKNFVLGNGSKIPRYKFWIQLWNSNRSAKIGEGLFLDNKICGYHSMFKKTLIQKKKKFNILVSSNWNVKKKYRSNSLQLISRFFNEKADILLTTTANKNVSEVWKLFKAIPICNKNTMHVYFKINNYYDFFKFYFQKNKIKFIFYLFSPIFYLLNFFLKKKKIFKKKLNNLTFTKVKFDNVDIDNFNKLFEKDNSHPMEKRSGGELNKYLKIISHNKKVDLIKIIERGNTVGYFVLVYEKKYHRAFCAEIRISKKKDYIISSLIEKVLHLSMLENSFMIEFKNNNNRIIHELKKNDFYVRKYKFNPYLIKFNTKKSYVLKKYINKNWNVSYLDGDCLL